MSYELFIATRYLKSKRRTGFISLISYLSIAGVAIGVAALIIVLSVMNGFETEVRDRIIGADAHIRKVIKTERKDTEADRRAEIAEVADERIRLVLFEIIGEFVARHWEKVAMIVGAGLAGLWGIKKNKIIRDLIKVAKENGNGTTEGPPT